MKLYGDYGSGSTRRVLVVLQHLNIDFEFEQIDLFKGEQNTDQFGALNPNRMIPVLVDGSSVLYEASAINIYLTEKYGSDLLPSGNDRYLTLQWMFWASEHFRAGPPILFVERIAKKLQSQPEDARNVAAAYALIRKFSAVLDEHLEDRHYVVGDHITLADIDIAAPFSQMSRTSPPFDEFPNVMAWHQRLLHEVPAWKRTRDQLEERIDELGRQLGQPL